MIHIKATPAHILVASENASVEKIIRSNQPIVIRVGDRLINIKSIQDKNAK